MEFDKAPSPPSDREPAGHEAISGELSSADAPDRASRVTGIRVLVVAAAHVLATLLLGLVIFDVNLIPCEVSGNPPHRWRLLLLLGLLGALELVTWAYLARRWRRPWLWLVGGVIAVPVLWLTGALFVAPAEQLCP